MELSTAQLDRACGVLLGAACGDALGAGYEFGTAMVGPEGPRMIGGGLGGFEPGEWTDDTAMTWVIAEVAATGADLRDEEALNAIARGFREWYDTQPPDIGIQTRLVLSEVGRRPLAVAMAASAEALHARTRRTAGNGSLMRTSPVALAHLEDPLALVDAAMRVSALTHYDPRAQEACALWCLAIRHAVLTGELDVRAGVYYLSPEAQSFWLARLDEAEQNDPRTFAPNGYSVTALQAAWSAIVHTPTVVEEPFETDAPRPPQEPAAEGPTVVEEPFETDAPRPPQEPAAEGPTVVEEAAEGSRLETTTATSGPAFPRDHLEAALVAAIGIGDDTDTVASIAGALLGARWGASAFPAEWRRIVHGYPGRTAEDLVQLAHLAAAKGPGKYDWPLTSRIDYSWEPGSQTLATHPHDEGVLIGGAASLDRTRTGATAVVSLCLVGTAQVPDGVEHVVFRLIDQSDPEVNPHLDYVIDDAARTVHRLRAEGHTVLLHCVAAHSRTPTVAIRYAHLLGVDPERAFEEVCAALPEANPNSAFRASLARLAAGEIGPSSRAGGPSVHGSNGDMLRGGASGGGN